jgi:hypothetical protein
MRSIIRHIIERDDPIEEAQMLIAAGVISAGKIIRLI